MPSQDQANSWTGEESLSKSMGSQARWVVEVRQCAYGKPMSKASVSSSVSVPTKRGSRLRKAAIAVALVASFGIPVTAHAATAKAGATCTKAGRTAKAGKVSLKCTKSKGKLRWVTVKKKGDTTPPDTKAPDTKAPDTKAPDTKAPSTKAPDTKAPDTKAA
jgi:hypothetical protein